jgi:hypothetical protein
MTHLAMATWVPLLFAFKVFSIQSRLRFDVKCLHFLLLFAIFIPVSLVYLRGQIPGPFIPILYLLIFLSIFTRIKFRFFQSNLFHIASILLVFCFFSGVIFTDRGLLAPSKYQYLKEFWQPPNNMMVVPKEIAWASRQVIESNSTCLFDFTNAGLIAGVTNLPLCVSLSYPVYGTKNDEKWILRELQKSNPNLVVSDYSYWSFSIDGLPMSARFPKIYEYLLQEYPNRACLSGICVRYRSSTGATTGY